MPAHFAGVTSYAVVADMPKINNYILINKWKITSLKIALFFLFLAIFLLKFLIWSQFSYIC